MSNRIQVPNFLKIPDTFEPNFDNIKDSNDIILLLGSIGIVIDQPFYDKLSDKMKSLYKLRK
jgi:hypothetical protein